MSDTVGRQRELMKRTSGILRTSSWRFLKAASCALTFYTRAIHFLEPRRRKEPEKRGTDESVCTWVTIREQDE